MSHRTAAGGLFGVGAVIRARPCRHRDRAGRWWRPAAPCPRARGEVATTVSDTATTTASSVARVTFSSDRDEDHVAVRNGSDLGFDDRQPAGFRRGRGAPARRGAARGDRAPWRRGNGRRSRPPAAAPGRAPAGPRSPYGSPRSRAGSSRRIAAAAERAEHGTRRDDAATGRGGDLTAASARASLDSRLHEQHHHVGSASFGAAFFPPHVHSSCRPESRRLVHAKRSRLDQASFASAKEIYSQKRADAQEGSGRRAACRGAGARCRGQPLRGAGSRTNG